MKKISSGTGRHKSFAALNSAKSPRFNILPFGSVLISAALLAACGGGSSSPKVELAGGDSPPSTNQTDTPSPSSSPAPVPAGTSMTMNCMDGATYQCSGNSIIRSDNGVALTSSGVQVYGKSTSDLATPIAVKTTASGFMLASGGTTELRIAKDANNGTVSSSALLLSNFGISWDGKNERPLTIETFQTNQGRVELGPNGAITNTTLPANTNLSFYDFANKGVNGTQANYANNRYFPRTGNPSRCPADLVPCPSTETTGLHSQAGDWRTGGTRPDWSQASRLHADGDVHAGDGLPDANGRPTYLTGASGPGIPFPGSKGYRSFSNWGLRYSNLASWESQDTVLLEEWAMMSNEHNKNRRGMVAFGDVTAPERVPTTGSASYSGIVYGWYARTPQGDPSVFIGSATMTVDFATRKTVVTLSNATTYDAAALPVPVALTANTLMGAAGANVANYLTAPVKVGAMTGGLSGRYFGPLVTDGTSGAGPAEAGGTFSFSNSATGEAAIGGFIARKQ